MRYLALLVVVGLSGGLLLTCSNGSSAGGSAGDEGIPGGGGTGGSPEVDAGGAGGVDAAGSAGVGGTGTAGNAGSGGVAGSGGGTATGGSTASGGGTGNARSCERDCADLANTLCAEDDFSIETCVPQCEQAFQDGVDGAREIGCLDEFLVLDACRVDDPVCTHPNPMECVEENASYIQCLEDAI